MAVSRLNKAADTRRDGRYYALLTNLQAVVISNVVLARLQTRRAIIFNRVCLSVCLCVSDRHVYPSALTDFDETWSQGLYSDLVWPRQQWSRSATEGPVSYTHLTLPTNREV